MAFICADRNDLIIAANSQIFVFDTKKQELNERSWTRRVYPSEDVTSDTQTVCCRLSPSARWFAFADNQKKLHIFQTQDWKLLKTLPLSKQATALEFATAEEEAILVADRAGNVSLIQFMKEMLEAEEDDEEGEKGAGKILLGHVSMLLDLRLSPTGSFLVSADRDEKIRVSSYPNAYNIQSFCLGHTEYVRSIDFLTHGSQEPVLVSSSGDGSIRFWDLVDGKGLLEHKIGSPIRCISVCTQRPLVASVGEDGAEVHLVQISWDSEGQLKLEKTGKVELWKGCGVWCLCWEGERLWVLEKVSGEQGVKVPPVSCFSFDEDLNPTKSSLDNWTWPFLEGLRRSREDLPPLTKNVHFGNMEAYLERKRIRIEGTAGEKRKRSDDD